MGHFLSFSRSFAALNASGLRVSGLNSVARVTAGAAEFTAQGIGGAVQFFLLVDAGGIGEKVHLLKVVLAGLFGADPHQPHGALRPHLAHQLDCHMVEAVRGVRRVGQRRLVARAAEGVVHQLYRDDTGRLAVGAQTPPTESQSASIVASASSGWARSLGIVTLLP